MSKIVIGICTYNRNDFLNVCLDNLLRIKVPADAQVEIVVVDGSKNGIAEELVNSKNAVQKFKFHYFAYCSKCIAAARNKVLKEVRELEPDYILFIDDDEFPGEDWLVNLYEFMLNSDAAVVTGPSLVKFVDEKLNEVAVPCWMSKNSIFRRKPHRKNGHECATCATNNVLIKAEVIEKLDLWFDETYQRMTGEDLDFFSRVCEAGYKILWCKDAHATELIGAKRANLKFILDRNYNNGYLRIFNKRKNNRLNLLHIAETLFNLVLFALLLPFSLLCGPVVFVEMFGRLFFAYGAFVSLFRVETLVHYKN